MTDPKTATPSTDDCICEDVRVLGACPVHEPRSTEPANDNLVAAWLADLQGMDDADREHDVTVLDTRSLLYRIAADAETIRKQAEEIEALRQAFGLLSTLAPKVVMGPSSPAEVIATAKEIHKGVSEEIEQLTLRNKEQSIQKERLMNGEELVTLREQVRTLREALKAALGHCDCSDYHGKALIPCTEAHPCAGCRTTRTGQAALAATEPKG